MEFGLHLPTTGDPSTPELLLRVADEAEQMGLASVWMSDGLLRPVQQPIDFGGGMSVTMPPESATQCDVIETLTYVAARTSRIRLGTSVIGTLFQNPVALARRLATLDLFSGGRLIAGLGQGWVPQMFAVADVPLARRGAGFEEHIQAMRSVWGPDPVRFDGRFYQIPASQIGPKPVRPGGPALLAGAAAPAAAQRAGRLGIGLHPVFFGWDALRHIIGTFHRAAEDAGHDPAALPIVVRVNGAITSHAPAESAPLTGTVARVADDVDRLAALGVGHVIWFMPETEPTEQLDAMRALLAVRTDAAVRA
ncbi:MAG TPA: TIGR03619 family F420-dependent LLM class oxidoreductase [Pseudonocardiaceae bacterium]|nr:TIGR03619 family F420-dependent LLM class oxidoreductase [Pseudonocardiaceae bacterium]